MHFIRAGFGLYEVIFCSRKRDLGFSVWTGPVWIWNRKKEDAEVWNGENLIGLGKIIH